VCQFLTTNRREKIELVMPKVGNCRLVVGLQISCHDAMAHDICMSIDRHEAGCLYLKKSNLRGDLQKVTY